MSKITDGIKLNYTKLSNSEKEEIKGFIKEWDERLENRSFSTTLNEQWLYKSLGPMAATGICPRCGGSGVA